MDQEDAARHSREMTEAVAAYCTNVGIMPVATRMQQFQSAAFDHISELVPDNAVVTVISVTEEDGLPMLVAVAGQQFYKLSFGEIEIDGEEVPNTVCEKFPISPDAGAVSVAARYQPTPIGAASRLSSWAFQISDRFGFSVETRFNPERAEVEQGERFARALAGAMGWGELT